MIKILKYTNYQYKLGYKEDLPSLGTEESQMYCVCRDRMKKNGTLYHLGYVPRYYSKELSRMLDEKVKYSAKIKYLNFESKLDDEDITADVKLIFNSR